MPKALEYVGLIGRHVRMDKLGSDGLYRYGVVTSVMDWAEADAVEVTFRGGDSCTVRDGETWKLWIREPDDDR